MLDLLASEDRDIKAEKHFRFVIFSYGKGVYGGMHGAGMNEKDENYPDSAISSWSGFVYQGKIALYHCLTLILQGCVDFELQLDSTDDFAIYRQGTLSSAHQVKAKVGIYRSSYATALEKSAKIELDRIAGIVRYFHVSVAISDTTDHVDANGEIVKFYSYGDDKYCALDGIETLTKALISKICASRSIELSDNLLDSNYCVLSERISSKAIEIHKKIQVDGDSERKAAYTNRISGESILQDILNRNPYDDTVYYAIELKSRLHAHLEARLEKALPDMTDVAYQRARRLYEHIRDTRADELKTLCQMMKPSERFSHIQKEDIRRYADLIQKMGVEPILETLPHYRDKQNKFYVPTALNLHESEEHDECAVNIRGEMKSNDHLLKLLYEYNNLIAAMAQRTFLVDTKYTVSADLDEQETQERIDSNITKTLCISIVTKQDAEARLNDH
ncbi:MULTISPECIES: ABC-three component system protein [Burkholderia]|uniref:ABC-three component system protein n=1 Tax=Burkholderia TaxID=32008 RepID=UPI000A45E4C9|nr:MULTISPECIES: ABC-three component system protein [Burkholderia]